MLAALLLHSLLIAGAEAQAPAPPNPANREDFDVVVRNGRVIDPESGLDGVRSIGIREGQIAALVDGGDFGEGVVIFGPDGAVLRQATFKALGISGRITSLAMDRSGGLILCDRRNDLLIRLN